MPCPDPTCPRQSPASFVTTPLRCKWCSHVHFYRAGCEVSHLHPTHPPSDESIVVDCRCRSGASRALAGLVTARPSIPDAIRRAVVERDGDRCCFCGRKCLTGGRAKRWPKHRLTLDHIVPYSKGGPDTVDNLRVACLACNVRRGTGDLLPLFAEAS